jgi:hypothetical protein
VIIVGTHIDQISKYALSEITLKKRYACIVGFHYVSSYDGTNIPTLTKSIVHIALNEKYMVSKMGSRFSIGKKNTKKLKTCLNYVFKWI